MQYEVEVKIPLSNPDSFCNRLRAAGARALGERAEEDHYFRHPVRDFAKTDEAFRLRAIGDSNCMTYKGPKIDSATKTRREIEVSIEDGEHALAQATELFLALGFQSVARVKKRRDRYVLTWHHFEIGISIDTVESVGTFVEIETFADDSNLDSARSAVTNLARELGLEGSERRSYLELLLERES